MLVLQHLLITHTFSLAVKELTIIITTYLCPKLNLVGKILQVLGNQFERPLCIWTEGIQSRQQQDHFKKTIISFSKPVIKSNNCGLRRAGQINLRNKNPLKSNFIDQQIVMATTCLPNSSCFADIIIWPLHANIML